MKRIISFMLFLPLFSNAQRFYAGAQAGGTVFWGDIRSLGQEKRPGATVGLSAGGRLTPWLFAELAFDHGVGLLGASKDQADDYIDRDGVIRYVQGSWKLGGLYSRTGFVRAGLRLPVSVKKIFRPAADPWFNLLLAPHIYLNRFTPGLYDLQNNRRLGGGAHPSGWSYAAGGDLQLDFCTDARTRLYLRPSLSWLSDERFEGISSQPAWRVNLMLSVTAGIKLDIGSSR